MFDSGFDVLGSQRPSGTNVRRVHSRDTTVCDLYERLAARYIEDRAIIPSREREGSANVPSRERTWLDRFIADLPERGHVLDLGCGAGAPIGAYLLARGCTLTGVDASPSLIAHCIAEFPQGEWLLADMRGLALGRRFDGLIAWDSFFHLGHDDQRAMFDVFAAHTTPGAMLMFTSGPEHGEAYGDYHGETLYHASLAPEEYERLLASAGFRVVAHVVEDPDCGGHTVWLAKRAG